MCFASAYLITLVNACESGLLQVYNVFLYISILDNKRNYQVKLLIENIEKNTFWTIDHVQLHQLKKEILSQITRFPVNITASRFFTIDRRFSTGVSFGVFVL